MDEPASSYKEFISAGGEFDHARQLAHIGSWSKATKVGRGTEPGFQGLLGTGLKAEAGTNTELMWLSGS